MKLRHRLAIAAAAFPVACSPARPAADITPPRPKIAGPGHDAGHQSVPDTSPGPATTEPATTIAVATTSTTVPGIDVADFTPPVVDDAPEPAGDVEWLVRQTFPEAPDKAAGIANCESDFDPFKTGSAGERGVMQIHPVHKARIAAMGYTWDQMYQVLPNLAVARAIYDESGWGPWTCR